MVAKICVTMMDSSDMHSKHFKHHSPSLTASSWTLCNRARVMDVPEVSSEFVGSLERSAPRSFQTPLNGALKVLLDLMLGGDVSLQLVEPWESSGVLAARMIALQRVVLASMLSPRPD